MMQAALTPHLIVLVNLYIYKRAARCNGLRDLFPLRSTRSVLPVYDETAGNAALIFMVAEYSCLPPHDAYAFCNVSLPEPTRLDDLVGKLTTTELIGQLFMDADLAFGNTTYPTP